MAEQKISVKAPGKILWIGGYSVLEKPNTSLVTTVNAYVNAEITQNADLSVKLDSPQLKMSASCTIDKSTGKVNGDVPKELLLFKTAAEVATRYVTGLGIRVNGFNVSAKNDSQFSYSVASGKTVKSGLGSSAAVTVATVGSVMKSFGFDIAEVDIIHKLAQIAHSIATGKVGSGFDIAASTYGSIIYTRYSPEILGALPADYTNQELVGVVKKTWDCTVTPFPMPQVFDMSFANFVGEAMNTASALGSVADFKKGKPDEYGRIVRHINSENVRAIEALKRLQMGETDTMGAFRNSFDKARLLTKKLGELSGVGIEPDDCTSLIESSKHNGAFVAKLPGAGGRDAIAGLSSGPSEARRLRDFWSANKNLDVIDVKIDNKGLVV